MRSVRWKLSPKLTVTQEVLAMFAVVGCRAGLASRPRARRLPRTSSRPFLGAQALWRG
jgi:hypothetical protein